MPKITKTMSIQHLMGNEQTCSCLWSNPVQAKNGMMYCLPRRHTRILKINTATNHVGFVEGCVREPEKNQDEGVHRQDLWPYAASTGNGCIYGFPRGAKSVLKFDPTQETTSFIPLLDYHRDRETGIPVRGNDGHFYFIPQNRVVRLNTESDTMEYIGAALSPRTEDHDFGLHTLAFNGKIYGRSGFVNQYFVVNPLIGVSSLIGEPLPSDQGGDPYVEGIQHNDNKVYFVPSMDVLVIINTETDDLKVKYKPFSDYECGRKIYAADKCCRAPNGKHYDVPGYSGFVVEIDLTKPSLRHIGQPYGQYFGAPRSHARATLFRPWSNILLGKDGCCYGIPNSASQVVRVDGRLAEVKLELVGEKYPDDEWESAALADNGKIFCMPKSTSGNLLVVDTSRWVHVGELIMIRALVEKGRATLDIQLSHKRLRNSNASHIVGRMYRFLFVESPRDIFAFVLSYL